MATIPPLPEASGIRVGDVGGDVNFSALGDIVGGDKITTITTTIQISVEAVTQRPLITTSPYRGLDRFEDRDKDLFFGRDQLIKSLLAQLSASNVLLVLGASGSGKSSVVRAGLLPQLSQLIGARFRYFTFVPDVNPFESLRSSLQGAGFSQAQTRELADARPETLPKLIPTLQRAGDQWLFFVDQFEEVFTVGDEKLRANFIAALTQIAQGPNSSAKLVLAMRADFLDRFSPFPQFAKIIEKNIDIVANMHADELRQAIEQPAARYGVVFEQGLVEEIIKDVQGQAGSLPLLQYTLNLLWEEEARADGLSDRHLNTKTYRELGGVRGALQKRANEIYASFGDSADAKTASPKQEIVRQIFLRLVDLAGEDANAAAWRPVRRRASISMFATAREQEVLQSLIDQKLLVSNREGDDATVEVAHEALFTSWDRLKNWIEAGKQVIFAKNRLADDARRWQRRQQEGDSSADEELIGGTRLSQALDMRARGDFITIFGGLAEMETQFLDASLVQRDRRAQSELEAAQRLAAARKLATTRLQVGLAIAVVLLLAALGAILYARSSAQKSRQTFSEADFIRAADFLEQGESSQALAHLARAVETWPENRSAADRIFNLLTQRRFSLPITDPLTVTGTIGAVRFTPEGACLVAMINGKTVQIWNASTHSAPFPPFSHDSAVRYVQFSEDGKLLGVAGGVSLEEEGGDSPKLAGYAQLWNVENGQAVAGPLTHNGPVAYLAFNKRGDRLVTASEDKTARIWDTTSGKQVGESIQHDSPVSTAEFSADGTRIVTAAGAITVWNAEKGTFVCSARDKADATYLFSASDFYDGEVEESANRYRKAVALVQKLRGSVEPLSQFLWSQFSTPAQQLLPDLGSSDATKQSAAAGVLVDELNKILKGPSLYDRGRFLKVKLSSESLALSSQNPVGDERIRLNRLLLQDAYNLGKTKEVDAASARFSPDAKQLVGVLTSKDDDGTSYQFVRIFDATTGRPLGDAKNKNFDFTAGVFGGLVTSLDFSPDGSTVGVTYAARNRNKDNAGFALRLWLNTGQVGLGGEPNDHKHPVDSVRFSPDGKIAVTTCEDGVVHFWDSSIEHPARAWAPLKLEAPPRLAQFSPDGKRLLVISDDPGSLNAEPRKFVVEMYSVDSPLVAGEKAEYPKRKPTTETPDDAVLAVSADGTRAIRKTGRSAILYDAKKNQPLGSPLPIDVDLGDQGKVLFARFSPDGKCFVTGIGVHRAVDKGSARLWDAFTSRPLTEPLRHDRSVIGAVFSPDSRRLLTLAARSDSGGGCAPRIWDVPTGRPLSDTFAPPDESEYISADAAEFVEDGRRVLLSFSEEEKAEIWDVGLPAGKVPSWFPGLATIVGGYELDEKSNIIRRVPDRLSALNRLRSSLATSDAKDPFVLLPKWILGDSKGRTKSPYSKIRNE
jgi:WD40 repeat protein